MADYDASVIKQFAEGLYAEAKSVVIKYTLVGVLLGGGLGVAISQSAKGGQIIILGVLILIFGFIGFSQGRAKSFKLKLEAQQALCFVKIEENTRS